MKATDVINELEKHKILQNLNVIVYSAHVRMCLL